MGRSLRELSTLQDNSKLFRKKHFFFFPPIFSPNSIVYEIPLIHILVNTWYCQIS